MSNTSSAILSPCRMWRYSLERSWKEGPTVNIIGLNPSTADETMDDPTVRRCIGFAKSWGFGRLMMTNLFALRSTVAEQVKIVPNSIGPENDKYVLEAAQRAQLVVCAWGNRGRYKNRGLHVGSILLRAGIPLYCLGLTNGGRFRTKAESQQPKHLLYLKATTRLVPYRAAEGKVKA